MKDHPMKIDVEKIAEEYATKFQGMTYTAIEQALRSILPAPGEVLVRDGDGWVKRKVLGTLPVTADGCVVGKHAKVYEIYSTGVWEPDWRDLFHRPLEDCYSTRSAAEAAGKEDA